MRADLERLLDDVTLVTLALAIAIGWSLFQVAHGFGVFVDGLLTHVPPGSGGVAFGSGLEWVVGRRVVDLDQLLLGVVELALTVGAALLVTRRASN
jgi:hypothetical protein